LRIASWAACLIAAFLAIDAFRHSSLTWRVHAVAVLGYAAISLLGRHAPLSALAALGIGAFAHIYFVVYVVVVLLAGGESVVASFARSIAGLASKVEGIDRIMFAIFLSCWQPCWLWHCTSWGYSKKE
jgi:hypothetical protein